MTWPTYSVAELAAADVLRVEDGNHGEYRPRPNEFTASGTAFIRAADLDGGTVRFDSAERITAAARARIRKGIGQPRDVLLSHKGTVGKVALAPSDAPAFVCSPQTTFWRSVDQSRLLPGFLYCYLRSPAFQGQLASAAGSTDMAPYVSLTQQRELRVELPPIQTQHAIAEVLGALDDKIGANTNLERAIDELALALYRGRARDGGECRRIGDMATVVLGGTPSRSRAEFWSDGTIPWIASGEANKRRVLAPTEWITEDALAQSAAKLMPRYATAIAITGATLGQVTRLEIATTGNQSLVGVWADDSALNDWIYLALLDSVAELVRGATGAAQQHINKQTVVSHEITVPGRFELDQWGTTVRALLHRAAAAASESLRLAATRDTLLPHLMTGRITVREAEKAVEEVL